MTYRVNGKNMSVRRMMGRGPKAEKRLKYVHVSPKGTTVVTPVIVCRVSLPEDTTPVNSFTPAVVIPQELLDSMDLPRPESTTLIDLPAGEPAVSGPTQLVPKIDTLIPDPSTQTNVFTCNADLLRKLLTVACEVCEDADKTVRLRFIQGMDGTDSLRIDSYAQPGKQEFVGVIKNITYTGKYIPGDNIALGLVPEVKPVQKSLTLKVHSGRRFRGENE